eukprot:763583-Hanusia_phi.AAC.1
MESQYCIASLTPYQARHQPIRTRSNRSSHGRSTISLNSLLSRYSLTCCNSPLMHNASKTNEVSQVACSDRSEKQLILTDLQCQHDDIQGSDTGMSGANTKNMVKLRISSCRWHQGQPRSGVPRVRGWSWMKQSGSIASLLLAWQDRQPQLPMVAA